MFCPPTIWTISLKCCRKPYMLEADDFLGACYRKAMTPKKLWTLLYPILLGLGVGVGFGVALRGWAGGLDWGVGLGEVLQRAKPSEAPPWQP